MEMKIKELAEELRPREKAMREGYEALSDEELLGLLIGVGVSGLNAVEIAHNLLNLYGGLKRMGAYSWRSYEGMRGVSEAKALSLGAVYEIARRINLPTLEKRPKTDPVSLSLRYQSLFANEVREKLILLMLDKKGSLIKELTMYQGTENGVRYAEGEVLKELASASASSFVMIHNHPSGLAAPTEKETEATYHLARESEKLSIRLLDHLIIGSDSYFSFKENEGKYGGGILGK